MFAASDRRRSNEIYQFGEFELNVGEHTLQRLSGGERVVISDKPFRTLVHLVRHAGALITRDEMLETVWPGVLVEDGNIGKVIHVVRGALGDRSGRRTYVETVPKHGYRFVAEVASREGLAASASSAAPLPDAASPGRSPAYDLYIRGNVKSGGENNDDTNEAIALLEAAVRLDGSCAGAYAQPCARV